MNSSKNKLNSKISWLFKLEPNTHLIRLRCAFWAWSCGFCGLIFSSISFYFYFHYIYVKEFFVMLKVLVDLLWWMGFIFCDMYSGGCKTMIVG